MQTIDWLSRLIAFDTTSRYSNLALINEIKTWFDKHSIDCRLTYDDERKKANLFATLPAKKNAKEGGLVLSGHTDVVPVDGQTWQTDPFVAVQKDGKIYGRGAADMKGFLAVILALLPTLKKRELNRPIHFAFSYDEEVGCHGAKRLLADVEKAGITPAACIVGEPTKMQPVIAHKGIALFRVTLKGKAAHSSLTPLGCNAIEYAAKLISHIRNLAEELKKTGPFDEHYDVPFTSISTNTIQGGSAHNIIPETCEFVFEFRYLPFVSPDEIAFKIKNYIHELEAAMQKEHAQASITMETLGAVPSFERDPASAIYQSAQSIIKDTQIHKVAYATEAGLFEKAHIPTIICGPGSIEQAHRPDEFVEIEQLARCEDFLTELIEKES